MGNIQRVEGTITLYHSDVKSLGNLEYVGGSLYSETPSKIQSLGYLKKVGCDINLQGSNIKSLRNLEYVGRNLFLHNSSVEDLGNLKTVNGVLNIRSTPLSQNTNNEDIRRTVKVDEIIN